MLVTWFLYVTVYSQLISWSCFHCTNFDFSLYRYANFSTYSKRTFFCGDTWRFCLILHHFHIFFMHKLKICWKTFGWKHIYCKWSYNSLRIHSLLSVFLAPGSFWRWLLSGRTYFAEFWLNRNWSWDIIVYRIKGFYLNLQRAFCWLLGENNGTWTVRTNKTKKIVCCNNT